jgi:hypothetical protein
MPSKSHLRIICALLLPMAGGRAASLNVEIRPTVSGVAMALDSLRYEKFGGEVFSVSRLSYLLSGLALEREDGVWVEVGPEVVWLDAGRRRSTFRLAEVADGKYRALRYAVGLPANLNSADPAAMPGFMKPRRTNKQGRRRR